MSAVISSLSPPQVMGILNLTPDSFYDGGRLSDPHCALARANELVVEGVDWIDLGGESTRPGARPVSLEEESARVLPVLSLLRQHLKIKLSIDTQKPALMSEAIQLGVDLINDVNALLAPTALDVIGASQVQVCLMHKIGTPQNMQQQINYSSCVSEVKQFLGARIQACEKAGIAKERLWVDPGFGFGKHLEHNLALLQSLDTFKELGCPILVGISRKSMLGQLTGRAVNDRLAGSLAANLVAIMHGAEMVRVHDVAPTVDAIKVFLAAKQGKQGW